MEHTCLVSDDMTLCYRCYLVSRCMYDMYTHIYTSNCMYSYIYIYLYIIHNHIIGIIYMYSYIIQWDQDITH